MEEERIDFSEMTRVQAIYYIMLKFGCDKDRAEFIYEVEVNKAYKKGLEEGKLID